MTFVAASETGPGWWTEGDMRLRSQPGGMPQNLVTHSLSSVGADASEDGTGRGTPLVTTALTCHAAKMGDPTTDIYHVAASGVRRLTPTECERLQALPDGWTLPGADSRRYAGLGDAVTASVAEWIGRRILERRRP